LIKYKKKVEKLKKVEYKENFFEYKENFKNTVFFFFCRGLKENYILKNGLYIKLHQITCNFF